MTEVERRSSSTSDVKKDPFRYVPDIIDERSREVEGMVINRYTKGLLLGKGGFAQVYLSTHLASKQQYALKIVAKSSLTKPRAKSKLQTEIKIHRALNHINIVRFQRFFEDSNFAYLVLELCSNNAMSDLLTNRKRITETETRFYLSQLVNSLQYLHRHLVIHRDLKLGNIFIDAHMRIKVGDFGLATKLEHPDERRMTVCGTPNYIAPELLDEAKKGHSFEVDVWSTGVIMYTLLVGKPPFQSKDVKSTYKRILANEYSYPADSMVSFEAKDLVSSMLKRRPEERVSLVGILEHAFFTSPHVFTPTSLPESALKMVPVLEDVHPVATKSLNTEKKGDGKMPAFGDENDPNAINRLPTANKEHRHATPALNAEQQQAFAFKKRTDSTAPLAPDTARSTTSAGSATSVPPASNTAARMTVSEPPKVEQPSSSRQIAARMRTGVSTRSSVTSAITSSAAIPAVSSSAASTTTTTSSISSSSRLEKRSEETYAEMYNRVKTTSSSSTTTAVPPPAASSSSSARTKFDIYMDSNPATARTSSAALNKENITKSVNNKDVPAYNHVEAHIQHKQDVAVHHTPSSTAIAKLNQDFQQMHVQDYNVASSSSSKQVTPPTTKLVSATSSDMAEHISQSREDRWKDSSEKLQPKTKRVKEAWIATTTSSVEGQKMSQQTLPTTLSTPTATSSSSVATQHYHDINNLAQASVASTATTAMQSEAMAMGTPTDGNNKFPMDMNIGTLEKMHEMLNENSFSFVDQPRSLNMPSSMSTSNQHNSGSFSRVWVVRYVDYTSKYGLGFLFNTGSAGVYFNDSTKIVLSACGNVFQYVERKSRDSLSNKEHVCQKYAMENYPKELQKKVTLLKHFRNYLVDQEKNHTAANAAQANEAIANAFGGNGVEDCGGYNRQRIQEQIEEPQQPVDLDQDVEMPFLKKWIRTKHAILFRMSNRTVQVVFYDRSEVLLSSEARQITYVNKSGERSEHMLDDIVLSGRVDIAKRLKYTKEIMHRLINAK